MTERIEHLLQRIPGYTGYRQKESMRDDDRLLREEIHRDLNQAVESLTAISAKQASERNLSNVSEIEDLVKRLRGLADRVQSASYGYGGIFSDRSVDEHALSQLKSFDEAFQRRAEALKEIIPADESDESVADGWMTSFDREISSLATLFASRSDVIETATPSNHPQALSLLDSENTPSNEEMALLGLRQGDAISILGDNFEISAHVALLSRSGTAALTLARIDQGSAWLAVTRSTGTTRAWNTVEAQIDAGGPLEHTGSAEISGPRGTKSDVPASWSADIKDDAESVNIQVFVEGQQRGYDGTSVPVIDIDVFTQSAT